MAADTRRQTNFPTVMDSVDVGGRLRVVRLHHPGTLRRGTSGAGERKAILPTPEGMKCLEKSSHKSRWGNYPGGRKKVTPIIPAFSSRAVISKKLEHTAPAAAAPPVVKLTGKNFKVFWKTILTVAEQTAQQPTSTAS